MKSDLMFVVAGIACLTTFFVVHRILKERLKLGPPGPLAACIAALAFLGLCGSGDGLVAVLLIPYATLALALLIPFLLFWLIRRVSARFRHGSTRDQPSNWDSRCNWHSSSDATPSSERPSTRPCRCHPPLGDSTGRRTSGSQTPANDATRL